MKRAAAGSKTADASKNADATKNPHKKKPDLSLEDVKLIKAYSRCIYDDLITKTQVDLEKLSKSIVALSGVKESNTGLAHPLMWDLAADRLVQETEPPLKVARCTAIMPPSSDDPQGEARYVVTIRQRGKYVTTLDKNLAPQDIRDGMRIGIDKNYKICLPLPAKISRAVRLMQVDDKPDVTYADIGGCKEQILKLREIIELPLTDKKRFDELGIEPPRGALMSGPPGMGKTLCARAVANRTDACFIRVIGSELAQRYIGEGAQLVRDLFDYARTKPSCIIFFDEIDAIGQTRLNVAEHAGSDNEANRTLIELINQLDGFDPRGNIKVLMATNRSDTLDPALMRPGRLDRKIEFGLPDLTGRIEIFKIHTRQMSVERGIRYNLLARLCPNASGADLRSICTEAGMFAIRERKKMCTEADFLKAIEKVIRVYQKFNSVSRYLTHQ